MPTKRNLITKLFSCSIWLLGYEFSDTIVLLTREKAIFAVSSKKSKYWQAKILKITNFQIQRHCWKQ